jgi:hypothetical protein
MRWIKRLFAPYIVAVSEPFSDGQKWSYIFGDENRFELRTFQNSGLAFDSHRITLVGLSLAPEISIKLIRLDAEQARVVQDEVAYRALIESYS